MKFNKSLQEIRSQIALQGAETVARLKQIETDLNHKLDREVRLLQADMERFSQGVSKTLQEGFSGFEATLTEDTLQIRGHLDEVLDRVAKLEQDQEAWRQELEQRVSRLEQDRPPAA